MIKPYVPPPDESKCKTCFDRGWVLIPGIGGYSRPYACPKGCEKNSQPVAHDASPAKVVPLSGAQRPNEQTEADLGLAGESEHG